MERTIKENRLDRLNIACANAESIERNRQGVPDPTPPAYLSRLYDAASHAFELVMRERGVPIPEYFTLDGRDRRKATSRYWAQYNSDAAPYWS